MVRSRDRGDPILATADKISKEMFDALWALVEARLDEFYDNKVYSGDGISIGKSAWCVLHDAKKDFAERFVDE